MKLLHKKIKTCKECPHFTHKDYYGIQCAYCTKLNTFFTDEDRVVEIQETQGGKNYISSFIPPLHNCPLPEVKNEEQQSEILHSKDADIWLQFATSWLTDIHISSQGNANKATDYADLMLDEYTKRFGTHLSTDVTEVEKASDES